MSSTITEIQALVKKVTGYKKGGRFLPYINFVQFQKYRNFAPNLRVYFDFPLTVVVGQNGTGKSSLLQSLSGAVKNESPGTWWFGTALDPIDEETREPGRQTLAAAEKAAFWYGYTDTDGTDKRALKTRIRREGDPDYWEPSKPVAAYGMVGKHRDPVISRESKYLNFKTQLSAFDRCFYLGSDNTQLTRSIERTTSWKKLQDKLPKTRKRPPRIQDYLRYRSAKLRRVLVDGKSIRSARSSMHEHRIELTTEELRDISRIIGREYTSGVILRHRFYETWGVSVLFDTKNLRYSEAFAGSGESAVARLVHEVYAIKPGAMLLLDEPETSLHPGAQVELVRFLLEAVAEKKLQVIVSTHSPAIIRHLPQDALRVFQLDAAGHVTIAGSVSNDEAFYFLGNPPENKKVIVVEDTLSKSLVEAVANSQSEAFASQFDVQFGLGGDSAMKLNSAIHYQDDNKSTYYFFDGDKAATCGPISGKEVNAAMTPADVDLLITAKLGCKVEFRQNSNMGVQEKIQIRLGYLEYINSRFKVLPGSCPEELIWDPSFALKLLEVSQKNAANLLKEIDEAEPKTRFERITQTLMPARAETSSTNIYTFQSMFVNNFINARNASYDLILSVLREIAHD